MHAVKETDGTKRSPSMRVNMREQNHALGHGACISGPQGRNRAKSNPLGCNFAHVAQSGGPGTMEGKFGPLGPDLSTRRASVCPLCHILYYGREEAIFINHSANSAISSIENSAEDSLAFSDAETCSLFVLYYCAISHSSVASAQ